MIWLKRYKKCEDFFKKYFLYSGLSFKISNLLISLSLSPLFTIFLKCYDLKLCFLMPRGFPGLCESVLECFS